MLAQFLCSFERQKKADLFDCNVNWLMVMKMMRFNKTHVAKLPHTHTKQQQLRHCGQRTEMAGDGACELQKLNL